MKSKIKLTFLLALWAYVGPAGANNLEAGTCEPIKVDMCRQIGYNKTGSNLLITLLQQKLYQYNLNYKLFTIHNLTGQIYKKF
jgi:hypothetical protein